MLRCKREEAKITAWENLQKAKAEAAIRKLEVLFVVLHVQLLNVSIFALFVIFYHEVYIMNLIVFV